ncbi:hypothetical protein CRES_0449 [Corynebacterium resistens DSM 45100]|uniref:Uncharacterized protein n=1 Tax=Corynebacterium resistens (strain DSM 45100 / JCM 12819 / GTC 2026 / SICGH 158) TaxID=662755 RepID=F8DY70_CORRG|nr:hypothetical protein [Corynebacterium resistens]AEI08812.1 hypothetical protein CRES_0449 [Corynebacterium resistens DSM 45100]
MTKAITYAALGVLLPLTPAITDPPTHESNAVAPFGITDWLSCSKKPHLPWCNK